MHCSLLWLLWLLLWHEVIDLFDFILHRLWLEGVVSRWHCLKVLLGWLDIVEVHIFQIVQFIQLVVGRLLVLLLLLSLVRGPELLLLSGVLAHKLVLGLELDACAPGLLGHRVKHVDDTRIIASVQVHILQRIHPLASLLLLYVLLILYAHHHGLLFLELFLLLFPHFVVESDFHLLLHLLGKRISAFTCERRRV